MKKMTVSDIRYKKNSQKLSMVTCYDYSFARAIDGKVDMILVGDSLGNVVLGCDRTTCVTMNDIERHLGAVQRGAPNTFIVADLPAGSYETAELAVQNAQHLLTHGADAIKPEGKPEIVSALTAENIPVMGHLGYLPQTAQSFKVVGRQQDEAQELLQHALAIQEAGAFSLVLECVPAALAKEISSKLDIPTIGIGSGLDCDGQVLVLYDLLGLFNDFKPRFVRRYVNMAELVAQAVEQYAADIRNQTFPSKDEEYS